MADVSKIKLGENIYNIKDKTAARKGMYVGTCSTAAGTAAKVATTDPFPLDGNDLPLVGTVVAIKFSNSNSYKTAGTTMTLNVNGTGAFPIYYNNAEVVSTTSANTSACGYKNRYTFYIFNGTQWVWLAYGTDSNTTYDDYSFGLGYGVQNNESASSTITVTFVSYKLKAGPVGVNFIYDVPANSTMNINSVGAKGIYYRGAAITSGIIKAGDLATFIYNKDDSKYHLISIDRWQEDIDDLYSTKADSSSLATVATSGSYNDLSNKPTIPDAQIQSNWNTTDTSSMAYIQNKPDLLDATYSNGTAYFINSSTPTAAPTNYYTKSEIDTKIGNIETLLASI